MTLHDCLPVFVGAVLAIAGALPWQPALAQVEGPSVSDRKLPAGEFPFLSDYSVNFKQVKPNWLPAATPDQIAANKQVVLRFYHGDMDVLADDFVEHDPAEPSTRVGWVTFIHNKHPGKQTPKPMIGTMATDADGHGLISMVGEGDIVVVVRKRNWPWPDGPTPVYNGIFVDIWRVQDGRLAEQWVSTTPSDGVPALIQKAKDGGYWNKK